MAFQIKNFTSIVAGMINHAKSTQTVLTDFNIGSITRTLMESPAVEMEEIYQRLFYGLLEAIPVATYNSFGFDTLPATSGYGMVTVSVAPALGSDMPVPAGTIFTTAAGVEYATDADAVFLAGDGSATFLVRAVVPGLAGNAAAGAIVSSGIFSDPTFSIVSGVISSGKDIESDSERAVRFADFISSLSQGTVTAVQYSAKSAVYGSEYITRSTIKEGGGHVYVYVYSSSGIPSAGLLASAQSAVDGFTDPSSGSITFGSRAAGVRVDVLPMSEVVVDGSLQIAVLSGYSLDATMINSLSTVYSQFISSLDSGAILNISSLIDSLLSVAGVKTAIMPNTSNVISADGEVLVPGTLTVSAL